MIAGVTSKGKAWAHAGVASGPATGLLWDTGTHAWFASADDKVGYTCPEGELIRPDVVEVLRMMRVPR